MVQIFFIYADNCIHCQSALLILESVIKDLKEIPCNILKFHYDTQAAIMIARNNGIDDLPGIVIGKEVFVGKNYTKNKLEKAILKAK